MPKDTQPVSGEAGAPPLTPLLSPPCPQLTSLSLFEPLI